MTRTTTFARPMCVILLAAVLPAACATDPDGPKRRYLASGDRYFAEQKYKEAIVEYRNAVRDDPRFGEARSKLAEAYLRFKRAGASAECRARWTLRRCGIQNRISTTRTATR